MGSGVRWVWGVDVWLSLPVQDSEQSFLIWRIERCKDWAIGGILWSTGLVSNGRLDHGGKNIKEKRLIFKHPYYYTFLMAYLFCRARMPSPQGMYVSSPSCQLESGLAQAQGKAGRNLIWRRYSHLQCCQNSYDSLGLVNERTTFDFETWTLNCNRPRWRNF